MVFFHCRFRVVQSQNYNELVHFLVILWAFWIQMANQSEFYKKPRSEFNILGLIWCSGPTKWNVETKLYFSFCSLSSGSNFVFYLPDIKLVCLWETRLVTVPFKTGTTCLPSSLLGLASRKLTGAHRTTLWERPAPNCQSYLVKS